MLVLTSDCDFVRIDANTVLELRYPRPVESVSIVALRSLQSAKTKLIVELIFPDKLNKGIREFYRGFLIPGIAPIVMEHDKNMDSAQFHRTPTTTPGARYLSSGWMTSVSAENLRLLDPGTIFRKVIFPG